MEGTHACGEELFTQKFQQIERCVRAVSAQHRLDGDAGNELYSLTMLKVVQDDFAVLRSFEGRSRWESYLKVIARRALLDQRIKEWGRWRPSRAAVRLGATAVWLDRRINRDELSSSEAIEELVTRDSQKNRKELESLVEGIPRRSRRKFFSAEDSLENVACTESTDGLVSQKENRRVAKELSESLENILQEIPQEDLHLLKLRFVDGQPISHIARQRLEGQRALYRRFAALLRNLRRRLQEKGFSWREVARSLDEIGDWEFESQVLSKAPYLQEEGPESVAQQTHRGV